MGWIYASTHLYTCLYMYIYMFICKHIYIYMYICFHQYLYIYIHYLCTCIPTTTTTPTHPFPCVPNSPGPFCGLSPTQGNYLLLHAQELSGPRSFGVSGGEGLRGDQEAVVTGPAHGMCLAHVMDIDNQ